MHTNSLTIQLNANAGPGPAQRNNAGGGENAQFGAMLSNEMALRQPAAPPAKAETPKPQAADKPAPPAQAENAAAQPATRPEDAAKPAVADKAGDAKDADQAGSEDEQDAQQAGAAADPASAMLALMASLQQPAQAEAGGAAGQAFDALSGAGAKGKRGEAAQLAALQAAMKSVSKDGAGIATSAGKAFSDTAALGNPALAAAGIGADDGAAAGAEAGARLGADLRAALAAGAGKAQADGQLATGELNAALALQQAREAETSRAAAHEAPSVTALAQAQPSVMEAAQAAAVAADELSARVGSEAWEKQVGQKVVYMIGTEEQTASLTLNPPDLGPLQVVLSVSNDQASVTFSANQEEVRQALEDALPRLREMMSESGIALGNATVNAGLPDGRQAQEQAMRDDGGFGRHGRAREGAGGGEEAAPRPLTRTVPLGERGMVDTFA